MRWTPKGGSFLRSSGDGALKLGLEDTIFIVRRKAVPFGEVRCKALKLAP